MWSEAPESIIQLVDGCCLELNKPQPVLPWPFWHSVVGSLSISSIGSWTMFVKATLPVPSLLFDSSVFLSFSSFHHYGYPCSLKYIFRVCFGFPQWVYPPSAVCPLLFLPTLGNDIRSLEDWMLGCWILIPFENNTGLDVVSVLFSITACRVSSLQTWA